MQQVWAAVERPTYVARFDWCRFSRPWLQTTQFWSSAAWVSKLARRCRRDHEHDPLVGMVTDRSGTWSRSEAAQALSRCFCAALLRAAQAADPAYMSARYGLRAERIGEASHPGPARRGRAVLAPVLTEGVTSATLQRYDAQLGALASWMSQHGLGPWPSERQSSKCCAAGAPTGPRSAARGALQGRRSAVRRDEQIPVVQGQAC